ncbi:MAG: methyltransferase domain-containing protein [Gammaproteobacteria bacterium]|nr:methyltransferase domain-containing protein [Gammaproteobacteria bacterium]
MNVQSAVLDRYSDGAKEVQAALCCPVSYDQGLLKQLPQEIIDKDYGCGDPSRYVRSGDTVLDLGSGGGKICYMAAQLVGKHGHVIGVDMNDDMLALARKYQPEMAKKLGSDRVKFVKGHIQDLALDVDAMEQYLAQHPVRSAHDLTALHKWQHQQRTRTALIADNSVDLVISNCVLNLVHDDEKKQLVEEIYRVLKPGGRVAISDIISDELIPEKLKADDELWSGCISGAFQEQEFIQRFLDAGFLAVAYDKWEANPWQTVDGIEFRSATLTAQKGAATPCMDRGHAVIYRGPFSSVSDDEDHIYPRGERMAVCERTFKLLTEEAPYKDHFIGIAPNQLCDAVAWCAPTGTRRPATETKGAHHSGDSCGPSSCC